MYRRWRRPAMDLLSRLKVVLWRTTNRAGVRCRSATTTERSARAANLTGEPLGRNSGLVACEPRRLDGGVVLTSGEQPGDRPAVGRRSRGGGDGVGLEAVRGDNLQRSEHVGQPVPGLTAALIELPHRVSDRCHDVIDMTSSSVNSLRRPQTGAYNVYSGRRSTRAGWCWRERWQ